METSASRGRPRRQDRTSVRHDLGGLWASGLRLGESLDLWCVTFVERGKSLERRVVGELG
jgi:hypothetical protein